jgi:DNA modification methylase
MIIEQFADGYVILGDSTTQEAVDLVKNIAGKITLIVTDPPYGNIVSEKWDRVSKDDNKFAKWMFEWTELWSNVLIDGGAFYVWGGLGKPKFRPFFKYLLNVEESGILELSNVITWSKKRAYGVKTNYLWTREECAYFVKGNSKHPAIFNIPLLNVERGYAGYNKKYPAKSKYLRRTNVWSDITELFKNKDHPTQKQQRVIEIPIETHTNLNDWVVDPFGGAGTTAFAARKLGRKFIIFEKDEKYFNSIVKNLRII